MDWAGLVIERLVNQTLESYMKANIWDPLGVIPMTFFPKRNAELNARIPIPSVRGPNGKLYPYKDRLITADATGCFGGHGAYGSMRDFLTLQRSLLTSDGKLLRPETVDLLFRSEFPPGPKATLKDV
jgi:CubicO group peptidase (beta-lactamase class C family)